VEEEMTASERELRGRDARLEGTVVITAGDGIASYLLVPWLVDFRRLHPGIALDLRADNRTLDLTRREADVAVRLFRPREASLVAVRAGEMPFALYGSEAYFARRTRPRGLGDLGAHDWIAWDARIESSPQSRWLARHVPRDRVVLRANTTGVLVAACVAGHGLAVLPIFVAAVEARLVPVLARVSPPPRPVWIATHADARKSARVQVLVEWLAGKLRAGA
jgi:DNA-binding transcriptional LysR family regulator